MDAKEKQNLIYRKIEYFYDLWNHYLHNATSNFSGLTLYSPHLLLKDISDEYKYQKFSNENNRKFFKKKLEIYMKRDLIRNQYLLEFHKLNSALGNKNYEIANEITRTLLNKFNVGKYFSSCFDELVALLFDDSNNFSAIKTLTNDIIIEFMLKGKTLNQIKKMIRDIFDNITEYKDEKGTTRYHTSFPFKSLKIKYDDIKNKPEVRDRINNLSTIQRIKTIKYLYDEKDTNYFVLFNIMGLKYSGKKTFKIKDIEFYTYPNHKIIKVDTDFYHEYFRNKEPEKTLNALVPIIASNEYVAEELAREKLESILAMLRTINIGEPYYEIKDEYMVLSKSKRPLIVFYGKRDITGQQIDTKRTRAIYNLGNC